MPGRYIVSTEIEFSASHELHGFEGGCERMHGHNWVVRAYYEFEKLDDRGVTVDYMELKQALNDAILPHFDHRHLNDVAAFSSINPTSENIAAEIFRLCAEQVGVANGTLVEIELWETPADMVRYRE
jgi:6-pyruvoyltetrahydropterin/6-carboxytetrahydropterin synthase